jgi:hypothetical protein
MRDSSLSVGGKAAPPMRKKECVSRAPVCSSQASHTHSRALRNHRKGVKAPSSMAMAPLHVRWSERRDSSPRITR